MKDTPETSIMIVEDEMILAENISMELCNLGYRVTGIHNNAEDALGSVASDRPDIILMDITLEGGKDGIDAAIHIEEEYAIPVIFLTANTDDATFQRAMAARPYAFLSKPFQVTQLERACKMVIQRKRLQDDVHEDDPAEQQDHISSMDDRLFIRVKSQMVKVQLSEILFAEADRNYCKLYTKAKTYLLSVPLGVVESHLPEQKFFRVHRSFVVNLRKIDIIHDNMESLGIEGYSVPISRRSKEELAKHLRIV